LSVSTSARTSPVATASPSAFFHSTRRPSSIVGESASITTLVAMSVPVADGANGGRDLHGVHLRGLLEVLVVRHRDVRLMHANDRGVEVVERLALHEVGDLRADAGEAPALLRNHEPVRLAHRGEHRG